MVKNDVILFQSPEELRDIIEFLRKELIEIGQNYGLANEKTIRKSQELDIYLSLCQSCCPPKH